MLVREILAPQHSVAHKQRIAVASARNDVCHAAPRPPCMGVAWGTLGVMELLCARAVAEVASRRRSVQHDFRPWDAYTAEHARLWRCYFPKPLSQSRATWAAWQAEYRIFVVDVQAISIAPPLPPFPPLGAPEPPRPRTLEKEICSEHGQSAGGSLKDSAASALLALWHGVRSRRV